MSTYSAPIAHVQDFTSQFSVGDRVHADGDKSIDMTVTAHLFRGAFVQLECSWFAQPGAQQQAWIEEWRLRLVQS